MRWLSAIRWLAVTGFVVAVVAACAGSDDAVPAQFAEECDGNCGEGLECVNRVCTLRCTMMTECTPYHATAICDTGYCYVPCVTRDDCPGDLTCTQTQLSNRMTCRAQP
jgi:hypothetical protein